MCTWRYKRKRYSIHIENGNNELRQSFPQINARWKPIWNLLTMGESARCLYIVYIINAFRFFLKSPQSANISRTRAYFAWNHLLFKLDGIRTCLKYVRLFRAVVQRTQYPKKRTRSSRHNMVRLTLLFLWNRIRPVYRHQRNRVQYYFF